MSEGRRAVGSVELNGIRTGRAVRGQARGGCALRAVMRFALDREPNGDRSGELPDTMTEVIAVSNEVVL